MSKPHYEVVCAVIIKDNLVFCTKRDGKGECANKWEFPGGKIEPDETKEEALLREIKEELNSDIKIKKFLTTINHEYNTFNLTMHVYICELINNKDDKKIRRLYLDAVMELEKMLMEIEETTINLLFKYLDNSYYKLVDNVLRPEYKFDLGLRYTIIKNATELHVFEFIKEKREQINQMLTLEYYKVKKLMKIKNNGDEI